jgi:hypothetical protein
MQKVPDYREIELTLSRQTIVDQVAAFLYAAGIVHDDEEVNNIQFSDIFGRSDIELVKTKIFIKKHQQVDLVKHI